MYVDHSGLFIRSNYFLFINIKTYFQQNGKKGVFLRQDFDAHGSDKRIYFSSCPNTKWYITLPPGSLWQGA